MRKVIQITGGEAASSDDLNIIYRVLFALCDDGTMWRFNLTTTEGWVQVTEIPQPVV